jgi:cobalt-zinc-cadmium efflux system outer membrane protein
LSHFFRFSPVAWASLFFVVPVVAQETTAPVPAVITQVAADATDESTVALDELLRRAMRSNPQLPIARQSEEAARQRVLAARAFAGPTLQIVPRLAGNREAADEEAILSQPLDLFGKRRARAGVASAELRVAQAQSTLAERSLVVAVKNSATDLFAAQEAESLGQYQVEVAQLFRDAAARRAELGDVPPVQVQRIELELLRVRTN